MALYTNRIDDGKWDYFKDLFFFYQSFNVYIKRINSFLEEDVASEKDIYENYLKALKEEDDLFEEFNYESDWKATEGLVDIYYDSFIMSMYSFTEKKMYILSNFLSQSQNVKLGDIAGKGIFKYKKYLEKVCDIDFKPIEKDWDSLQQFNVLRNHLVHAEGNRSLLNGNQQLIDFLKTIHGVILTEENNFVNFHFASDSILYDFLNCSQRVIEYLYKKKG